MVAAASTVALLLGNSGPVASQTALIPRTLDGKPDLSGIWQAMTTANHDIQAHSASVDAPAGLGVVVGHELPYHPAALARKADNYRNRATADTEAQCFLPGVPRIMYMPHPFQIVQSDKAILFTYQYAGAIRTIFMEDPGPAPADSWMGWSVGKWDGDTLVVDATSFNDQTWFDRAGNFHSDALHVVERYTAIGPDHLLYEATIEDPKVFTRPWKISMPLYRRVEKTARIMEFKCVEFAEELIYGHLRKQTGR